MTRIPYVPQLRPGDDVPVIDDVDYWLDLSALDDDPHAGCYQPHNTTNGPADCNGQPI